MVQFLPEAKDFGVSLNQIYEYLLACHYCENFLNMTRSDWMEMAVVEKLHNDGLLSDARFHERMQEIKTRPPRGRRKCKKRRVKWQLNAIVSSIG